MYFTEKEKSNMAVLFSEISNTKKNDFIFFYSDDLILSVKVENFLTATTMKILIPKIMKNIMRMLFR